MHNSQHNSHNCFRISLVGILILGCLYSPSNASEKENEELIGKIVSADNSFGFNLFHRIAGRESGDNILISPASLAAALTMTYNGASGHTKEAMAKTLGLRGLSMEEANQANAVLQNRLNSLGRDVLLNTANSLWAREGQEFREDFLKRNREFYDAKISTLDFAHPEAPWVIDTWVREKTGGKIEKIVETIPGGAILYLINAVYFRGAWAVKFDSQNTMERDFTLLDGSKKKVPMMMTGAKGFKYLRENNFSAVGLPYGDGRVGMYVFVPDEDSSLKELYEGLNAESWDEWMSRFQEAELMIVIPRFNLEYDIVLDDALTDLGMGVAFDAGAADFSVMCPGGGVWIDEVKHKTFLEVNEEGTEASAATSVRMSRGSRAVYVNRPFFCAIRDDDTGAILFIGSIVDP